MYYSINCLRTLYSIMSKQLRFIEQFKSLLQQCDAQNRFIYLQSKAWCLAASLDTLVEVQYVHDNDHFQSHCLPDLGL